jgi:hypothetical protein
LCDDPVFQPGVSAGYKGLTMAVWGNLELTNINGNSGDFSDIDYSINYSGEVPRVEGVGYSVGVIYYDFPGTAIKDTTEVYWGLDESKTQDLAISVSFPIEIDGWTIAPGISYITLLNNDIRNTDVYSTDSDYFVTGINISKRF